MEMLPKIRRMRLRDGTTLREVAKRTGLSRNTVRSWLRWPEVVEPKCPPHKSARKRDAWAKVLGAMAGDRPPLGQARTARRQRDRPGGPEEIEPEGWRAQFEHNLRYVHLATRIVAPLMVKQGGGSIGNISSIAGPRHLGNDLAAYAAAKAGLQQFSRVTAVRYARRRCA